MEGVNGGPEVDRGGPPVLSPLTGCYLLIVVGEPHCQDHKDIILRRIEKGLLSWDSNDCHVDLEKELSIITEQAPEGEEAKYGERLIQYASENLVTEVLIHPAVSTLSQCMKNLLSSFTRHRHIIHSGYTFAGNGSWILQDGTFSLADFSEAFQENEVQRVLKAYENTISLDLHCSAEGDWAKLPKEPFTKNCKLRLNPDDVLTSGNTSIVNFLNYLSPFLNPTDIESVLESSDIVGNIRFSYPTLYIFPAGQGDAALFGINGFNMLVDGGFSRKACFWNFVRHLDRLDAILLTRINNNNIGGISSVLRRKRHSSVYPQIGHFFCNIQERKSILSPDGDKDKDPLLVNLFEEGQELVENLRHISLNPQMCYRDIEPINLYHKVGHGTLDMYVLSPTRESKEVREFLQKWNSNDQKLFANQKHSRDFNFPVQNLVSVCALLVWQPANMNDNITRILFPGSAPQQKVFEGLDKLKQLEFFKYPTCSLKSLAPSPKIKSTKGSVIEKILQEQKLEKQEKQKEKLAQHIGKIEDKAEQNLIKPSERNGDVHYQKIIKKHDSTESEKSLSKSIDIKKVDDGKEINGKVPEDKIKSKPRADAKPKFETKPKVDAKITKQPPKKPKTTLPDRKPSPKKVLETKENGEAKEKEATPKGRIVSRTSPTSAPAKSAKEANNRKVAESKKVAPRKETPRSEKREVPERKPISRRTKGLSPAAKIPGSPQKKLEKKIKLEKEGTTDSSTVSTPSADQELKKDISKLSPEEIEQLKARELADLQEEQEVVKEIEAVFLKSEHGVTEDSELRRIKNISIEDRTDEEYLIIEKEEIEQEMAAEQSLKEGETQKHIRDSEESEKVKIEPETKIQGDSQVKTFDKEKEKAIIQPDTLKLEESKIEMDKKDAEKKVEDEKEVADVKSQPEDKFSTPIESGATTAPTLPEDERMPLEEIKETAIEEKYTKEETKERDKAELSKKTTEPVAKATAMAITSIKLDRQSQIRDIVKTPDEVADLPVHEEADIEAFDEYREKIDIKDEVQKSPEAKEKEIEKEEEIDEKKIALEIEKTEKDIIKEEKGRKEEKTIKETEVLDGKVEEKTKVEAKQEETKLEEIKKDEADEKKIALELETTEKAADIKEETEVKIPEIHKLDEKAAVIKEEVKDIDVKIGDIDEKKIALEVEITEKDISKEKKLEAKETEIKKSESPKVDEKLEQTIVAEKVEKEISEKKIEVETSEKDVLKKEIEYKQEKEIKKSEIPPMDEKIEIIKKEVEIKKEDMKKGADEIKTALEVEVTEKEITKTEADKHEAEKAAKQRESEIPPSYEKLEDTKEEEVKEQEIKKEEIKKGEMEKDVDEIKVALEGEITMPDILKEKEAEHKKSEILTLDQTVTDVEEERIEGEEIKKDRIKEEEKEAVEGKALEAEKDVTKPEVTKFDKDVADIKKEVMKEEAELKIEKEIKIPALHEIEIGIKEKELPKKEISSEEINKEAMEKEVDTKKITLTDEKTEKDIFKEKEVEEEINKLEVSELDKGVEGIKKKEIEEEVREEETKHKEEKIITEVDEIRKEERDKREVKEQLTEKEIEKEIDEKQTVLEKTVTEDTIKEKEVDLKEEKKAEISEKRDLKHKETELDIQKEETKKDEIGETKTVSEAKLFEKDIVQEKESEFTEGKEVKIPDVSSLKEVTKDKKEEEMKKESIKKDEIEEVPKKVITLESETTEKEALKEEKIELKEKVTKELEISQVDETVEEIKEEQEKEEKKKRETKQVVDERKIALETEITEEQPFKEKGIDLKTAEAKGTQLSNLDENVEEIKKDEIKKQEIKKEIKGEEVKKDIDENKTPLGDELLEEKSIKEKATEVKDKEDSKDQAIPKAIEKIEEIKEEIKEREIQKEIKEGDIQKAITCESEIADKEVFKETETPKEKKKELKQGKKVEDVQIPKAGENVPEIKKEKLEVEEVKTEVKDKEMKTDGVEGKIALEGKTAEKEALQEGKVKLKGETKEVQKLEGQVKIEKEMEEEREHIEEKMKDETKITLDIDTVKGEPLEEKMEFEGKEKPKEPQTSKVSKKVEEVTEEVKNELKDEEIKKGALEKETVLEVKRAEKEPMIEKIELKEHEPKESEVPKLDYKMEDIKQEDIQEEVKKEIKEERGTIIDSIGKLIEKEPLREKDVTLKEEAKESETAELGEIKEEIRKTDGTEVELQTEITDKEVEKTADEKKIDFEGEIAEPESLKEREIEDQISEEAKESEICKLDKKVEEIKQEEVKEKEVKKEIKDDEMKKEVDEKKVALESKTVEKELLIEKKVELKVESQLATMDEKIEDIKKDVKQEELQKEVRDEELKKVADEKKTVLEGKITEKEPSRKEEIEVKQAQKAKESETAKLDDRTKDVKTEEIKEKEAKQDEEAKREVDEKKIALDGVVIERKVLEEEKFQVKTEEIQESAVPIMDLKLEDVKKEEGREKEVRKEIKDEEVKKGEAKEKEVKEEIKEEEVKTEEAKEKEVKTEIKDEEVKKEEAKEKEVKKEIKDEEVKKDMVVKKIGLEEKTTAKESLQEIEQELEKGEGAKELEITKTDKEVEIKKEMKDEKMTEDINRIAFKSEIAEKKILQEKDIEPEKQQVPKLDKRDEELQKEEVKDDELKVEEMKEVEKTKIALKDKKEEMKEEETKELDIPKKEEEIKEKEVEKEVRKKEMEKEIDEKKIALEVEITEKELLKEKKVESEEGKEDIKSEIPKLDEKFEEAKKEELTGKEIKANIKDEDKQSIDETKIGKVVEKEPLKEKKVEFQESEKPKEPEQHKLDEREEEIKKDVMTEELKFEKAVKPKQPEQHKLHEKEEEIKKDEGQKHEIKKDLMAEELKKDTDDIRIPLEGELVKETVKETIDFEVEKYKETEISKPDDKVEEIKKEDIKTKEIELKDKIVKKDTDENKITLEGKTDEEKLNLKETAIDEVSEKSAEIKEDIPKEVHKQVMGTEIKGDLDEKKIAKETVATEVVEKSIEIKEDIPKEEVHKEIMDTAIKRDVDETKIASESEVVEKTLLEEKKVEVKGAHIDKLDEETDKIRKEEAKEKQEDKTVKDKDIKSGEFKIVDSKDKVDLEGKQKEYKKEDILDKTDTILYKKDISEKDDVKPETTAVYEEKKDLDRKEKEHVTKEKTISDETDKLLQKEDISEKDDVKPETTPVYEEKKDLDRKKKEHVTEEKTISDETDKLPQKEDIIVPGITKQVKEEKESSEKISEDGTTVTEKIITGEKQELPINQKQEVEEKEKTPEEQVPILDLKTQKDEKQTLIDESLRETEIRAIDKKDKQEKSDMAKEIKEIETQAEDIEEKEKLKPELQQFLDEKVTDIKDITGSFLKKEAEVIRSTKEFEIKKDGKEEPKDLVKEEPKGSEEMTHLSQEKKEVKELEEMVKYGTIPKISKIDVTPLEETGVQKVESKPDEMVADTTFEDIEKEDAVEIKSKYQTDNEAKGLVKSKVKDEQGTELKETKVDDKQKDVTIVFDKSDEIEDEVKVGDADLKLDIEEKTDITSPKSKESKKDENSVQKVTLKGKEVVMPKDDVGIDVSLNEQLSIEDQLREALQEEDIQKEKVVTEKSPDKLIDVKTYASKPSSGSELDLKMDSDSVKSEIIETKGSAKESLQFSEKILIKQEEKEKDLDKEILDIEIKDEKTPPEISEIITAKKESKKDHEETTEADLASSKDDSKKTDIRSKQEEDKLFSEVKLSAEKSDSKKIDIEAKKQDIEIREIDITDELDFKIKDESETVEVERGIGITKDKELKDVTDVKVEGESRDEQKDKTVIVEIESVQQQSAVKAQKTIDIKMEKPGASVEKQRDGEVATKMEEKEESIINGKELDKFSDEKLSKQSLTFKKEEELMMQDRTTINAVQEEIKMKDEKETVVEKELRIPVSQDKRIIKEDTKQEGEPEKESEKSLVGESKQSEILQKTGKAIIEEIKMTDEKYIEEKDIKSGETSTHKEIKDQTPKIQKEDSTSDKIKENVSEKMKIDTIQSDIKGGDEKVMAKSEITDLKAEITKTHSTDVAATQEHMFTKKVGADKEESLETSATDKSKKDLEGIKDISEKEPDIKDLTQKMIESEKVLLGREIIEKVTEENGLSDTIEVLEDTLLQKQVSRKYSDDLKSTSIFHPAIIGKSKESEKDGDENKSDLKLESLGDDDIAKAKDKPTDLLKEDESICSIEASELIETQKDADVKVEEPSDLIKSRKRDSEEIAKIDAKLKEMKLSTTDDQRNKTDMYPLDSSKLLDETFDKKELVCKSPKEREEDVIKIVASVAQVLKSDAPLEEFKGKVPMDTIHFDTSKSSVSELIETHITDSSSQSKDPSEGAEDSHRIKDQKEPESIGDKFVAGIGKFVTDISSAVEAKLSGLESLHDKGKQKEPGQKSEQTIDETVQEELKKGEDSKDIEKDGEGKATDRKVIDSSEKFEIVEEKKEDLLREEKTEKGHKTSMTDKIELIGEKKLIDTALKEEVVMLKSAEKEETVEDKARSKVQETIQQLKTTKVDVKEEKGTEKLSGTTQIVSTELKEKTETKEELREEEHTQKTVSESIEKTISDVKGFIGESLSKVSETISSVQEKTEKEAKQVSTETKEIISFVEEKIEKLVTETPKTLPSEKKEGDKHITEVKSAEEGATEILSKQTESESTSLDSKAVKDVVNAFIAKEKEDEHQTKSEISEKTTITKIETSTAGPSSKTTESVITSSSTFHKEELTWSGKSTPDIAEVETVRDKHDTASIKSFGESHDDTTPPTDPISSPIAKREGISQQFSSVKVSDLRSSTPASDDFEHSDLSSSQFSRVVWETEKQTLSDDDDLPGTPLSTASQVAASSSSHDLEDDSVKLMGKLDPMSMSLYGALPEDSKEDEMKSSRIFDEGDLDFEKAMKDHRQARGEDIFGSTSPSYMYEVTTAKYTVMSETGESSLSKGQDLMTSSFIGELPKDSSESSSSSKDKKQDVVKTWGKPLGLPSPAPLNDNKGTPKKERKIPPNVLAKNKLNEDKKLMDSKKNRKYTPVYVDLTYVPHFGNSNYCAIDYFKRVRARYYVFSGLEPSKEVYNALLEAKQSWEDKDLEVTIIPTYDTDVLGYWAAENEELLAKYKIDFSPSASRCTINLQDHETSCSAYRLEFS